MKKNNWLIILMTVLPWLSIPLIGKKAFKKYFFAALTMSTYLVLEGRLAEKIGAGGAGIPAFFTPAGVGTRICQNRETRVFNSKEYLLEEALTADFSLIRAWKADKFGNLIYNKTAQNFNPMMATAGKITIAEVELLEDVGELPPNQIHTPGIYVQKLVVGKQEKRIERITVRN